MRRALHPDLAKRSPDGEALDQDTAQEMIDATAAGCRQRARLRSTRRIDVRVVDVYGDIATAVVDSNVYREYLHLVRTERRLEDRERPLGALLENARRAR